MASVYGSMSRFFLNIFSTSLSGALVGGLILLIHPLTEKFFSKKWNYYIWLLVIIRLLLPVQAVEALPGGIAFDIASAWTEKANANGESGETEPAMEAGKEAKAAETEPTMEASKEEKAGETEPAMEAGKEAKAGEGVTGHVPAGDGAGEAAEDMRAADDSKETAGTVKGERESAVPGILILFSGAAVIWLIGFITACMLRLRNYYHFIRYIRKDACPVTDSRLMVLAQSMSSRLYMRKIPPIYRSAAVTGPVTVGLWRPVIFLPETGLGEPSNRTAQYQLILHHELVHVARRDLWLKWLYQILLCVHWFNPVIYLIGRKMNLDCELSCDEGVLGMLTAEGRKTYGNVLLDVAEQNAAVRKSALTTTFITGDSELKRRLQSVITFKKQTVVKGLLSLCVMAGTLFLTACGGVYVSYGGFEDMSGFWEYEASNEDMQDDGWGSDWNIGGTKGGARQVYDDEVLLAGADVSNKWQAYNYRGGEDGVTISRFALNGSDSIRIIYAAEDRDIEVTSDFNLKKGKFKIVHVAPDGTVSVINDTGEESTNTVTMQKGRNVIKIVGQAAALEDVEIRFSGLKSRYFEEIYYSEEDEYAGRINLMVQDGTVDKDKMLESIHYMEDFDISKAFAALLKQGETFSNNELSQIFIYSDAELSGNYLVEAIESGLIEPLPVDAVTDILPYLKGHTIVSLLKMLPEEDFFEGFQDCMPYMSDQEIEECLFSYLDAGGELTYGQFDDIEMYLNKSTIKKLDERMMSQP